MLEARRAGLELVLQEYIPGPPTCHYRLDGFIDRGGAVCACEAHRWLRRYPEDLSCRGGSYGVSIPLEEMSGAVHAVSVLLEALRYRGVFNAQLKYDERDGLFKILEVNARPGASVSFAAACGVDLVQMAYRDALGLPVTPVTEYEVGRHCLDPHLDLVMCWRLFREGRLTLRTWMRSWLGATQPTFCWDDPVPAFVSYFDLAWGFVRRRLHVRPHRSSGATNMASKKDVKSFFTERVEEWASNYAEPAPVSMNVQRLVSRKRFALELLEAGTPREARVLDVWMCDR